MLWSIPPHFLRLCSWILSHCPRWYSQITRTFLSCFRSPQDRHFEELETCPSEQDVAAQQHRASEAIHQVAACSTSLYEASLVFDNEVAECFFLDKSDEYSETELIVSCRFLNSCVADLSVRLVNEIKERNRTCGTQKISSNRLGSDHERHKAECASTDKFVRKFLGDRLYTELLEIDRSHALSEFNYGSIHDGIDAWSVSCIHSAINPTLFGWRSRGDDEIEEIVRHILNNEHELADRIRLKNTSQSGDSCIQERIENIRIPIEQWPADDEESEYAGPETSDRRNTRGSRLPRHLGALLHLHELKLPSYQKAIEQTEEEYQQGLHHVLEIAGVDPPNISNDFRESIHKIVKEAATLAAHTKTAVFSQSIDTILVKPEEAFDKGSMRSEDKVESGKVKCTIQLGLKAVNSKGDTKMLLAPEVLLN